MTRLVTWQSRMFKPGDVAKRYARSSMPCGASRWGYFVDDVNAEGYTIRTTKVSRKSLPAGIAEKCDALRGHAFNAVELVK